MADRRLITLTAIGLFFSLGAGPAQAHTESDLVAVPAGSETTLTLRPTHGCDGSPTVEVRIQAPLEDAVAVEVAGWVASSAADGQGNTVLTWSGGSLPADEHGAFPVSFVVPDDPGTLLVFPAIQQCEDGSELAWISGDPEDDFPAPRILVLPSDGEPAASIEEVPADAPGRDQLLEVVDVDNPGSTTTTSAATTTVASTSTTSPSAATTSEVSPSVATTTSVPAVEDGDSTSSNLLPIAVGAAVAILVLALILARRGR